MASKVFVLELSERGRWRPIASGVRRRVIEATVKWMLENGYTKGELRITTYVPQREAGRGVDR